MATKKLEKRSLDAQRLRLMGMTVKEIAEKLQVSTRTVGRYLSLETEEEPMVDLALLDAPLRDQYMARARPLLLHTLDDIEDRRRQGKLSNRDLLILASTVFTNIARLVPPAEEPKEEQPHTTFVLVPTSTGTEEETLEGEVEEKVVEDVDSKSGEMFPQWGGH